MKLTLYMKSGNVIELDRISKYSISRNTMTGEVTKFSWDTEKVEKGRLADIDLGQIEAIYVVK